MFDNWHWCEVRHGLGSAGNTIILFASASLHSNTAATLPCYNLHLFYHFFLWFTFGKMRTADGIHNSWILLLSMTQISLILSVCLCNVRCEMVWYQTDLLHLDIPNPNTTRFLPHVFPPPCLHLVLVAHIVKVLQNFLPAYIPTANCIVQWHRLLKMLNGSLQSVVCCAGIGDSIRYWLLAQLAGHAALLHKSLELETNLCEVS